MFVTCVHHVADVNAAFCMTCSLLILVEDARDDNIKEEYSRTNLMTLVAVSVFLIFVEVCVRVLRCCEYV